MDLTKKIWFVIGIVAVLFIIRAITTMDSDQKEVETFCDKAVLVYLQEYPLTSLTKLDQMKNGCIEYYHPTRDSSTDVRTEGW